MLSFKARANIRSQAGFLSIEKSVSCICDLLLACLCNEKLFGFIAAFRYVVDLKNDDRLAARCFQPDICMTVRNDVPKGV